MKNYLFLLISVLFISCNNYKNNKTYNIKVNETFEIYYSSNTTSYFVIENEKSLKNVKLIENKKISDFKNKIEGYSSNFSFKFKGLKKGTEKIRLIEKITYNDSVLNSSEYKIIIE